MRLFIRRDVSKYEAVYFVGDNQAINQVRVDSSKTRNQGAFSGSLAALVWIQKQSSILIADPGRKVYFKSSKMTDSNIKLFLSLVD